VEWEEGLQAHTQSFGLSNPGKIRENLGNIYESVYKIPENLGK